jgi:signal transduction histidine kinase
MRVFAGVMLIGGLLFGTLIHRRGLPFLPVGVATSGVLLYLVAGVQELQGVKRALLLSLCGLVSLFGYAAVGYISGPAVSMSVTLMLAGLLLSRRWLIVAFCLAGCSVLGVGWLMSHHVLAVPSARDVAPDEFPSWLRTTTISFLVIALAVSVTVQVVNRLERALEDAEQQARARERADAGRLEAERKALEAQHLETVGRIAAGVAHDFNNSLTAILGTASLLRSELSDHSEGAEMADEILEVSTRAAELTRQLLVFSRKAQVTTVPCELDTLVTGAIRLLQRSAPPGLKVVAQLDSSGPRVMADAGLIQNALLNLFLNAKDAMNGEGTLTVRTLTRPACEEHPSGFAEIEVEDTGGGIPSDVLPKIFEPFFTTKATGKGTGLGLASVAGTVRSHGGTVEVETHAGVGSVFRVRLPRLLPGQEPIAR